MYRQAVVRYLQYYYDIANLYRNKDTKGVKNRQQDAFKPFKSVISILQVTFLFTFKSILSKTKNNVKIPKIMLVSRQNNRLFVKDCFVKRKIITIFYRDVEDKMVASS